MCCFITDNSPGLFEDFFSQAPWCGQDIQKTNGIGDAIHLILNMRNLAFKGIDIIADTIDFAIKVIDLRGDAIHAMHGLHDAIGHHQKLMSGLKVGHLSRVLCRKTGIHSGIKARLSEIPTLAPGVPVGFR